MRRIRAVLARMAAALAWIAVALVCLLASIRIHLALPQTRRVARELIQRAVNERIRGELEIGAIDELGPGHVVARDLRLRDEAGRIVARIDRLEAWPDPFAWLDRGVIRVARAHVDRGEVVLYVQGDSVSLVEAFQGADRTPHPAGAPISPIPIAIDGIHFDAVDVHGDVPEYPGLRLDDVRLEGQIDVHDSIRFRVRDGRARMLGPYPGETSIDRIVVDFDLDWRRGLDAFVRAHRGGDRASAHLILQRPGWPEDPDAPFHLQLDARADPLRIETLASMEILGTEALVGTVRGEARMEGTIEEFVFRGRFVHDGGSVSIRGRIPQRDRIRVEFETSDFDLQRLVPSAPSIVVGGTLGLDVPRDPAEERRVAFQVRARPLEVVGFAVPAFEAEGAIERDRVVVERIAGRPPEGTVEGRGWIGFDGSVDVHAQIDLDELRNEPNVQRIASGVHGALEGTIDALAKAGGRDLAVTANLRARSFRWGGVRARTLGIRGRARGSFARPVVRLEAEGEDLVLGPLEVGTVELEVDGGPQQYQLRWTSRGPYLRSLEARATAFREGNGWRLEAPDVRLDVGTGPLRGAVREVELRGPEVRVAAIDLRDGDQRIGGSFHFSTRSERSHARVDIEGIDLERVGELLGLEVGTLRGRAQVHVLFAGTWDDPDLRLSGAIDDLSFDRLRHADLRYELGYGGGVLTTRIHGDFGPRGNLDVEGPIEVPFEALFDRHRFFDEARFGLHIYANHLNLAFVTPLLGTRVQALGITGRIGADLSLRGTLGDPQIDSGVILLDRFALPGWSELRSKVELSWVGEALWIRRLWIADRFGELGLAEARVHLSLASPPSDLPSLLRHIADRPWSLALRLLPRPMSQWPRPLGRRAPRGVVGTASLTAVGGDGRPARVDLLATLDSNEPLVEAPCARHLRPAVLIDGAVREGRARLTLSAIAGGSPAAFVRAEAATPIDVWLRQGRVDMPRADVSIQLRDLPLDQLPWTCSRFAGLVTGEARVVGLLGAAPQVEAIAEIRNLRVLSAVGRGLGGTAPHRVSIEARTREAGDDRPRVEACMTMAMEGGSRTPIASCSTALVAQDGEAIVRASIPLQWPEGTLLPGIAFERNFDLAIRMSDARLGPLLDLVPELDDADVIADGLIEARGPWETMTLSGGVALREGQVQIASLGQHLTDVGGILRFAGRRIEIPDHLPLRARDGSGTVAIWGTVAMRGLFPSEADLRVAHDAFPVRREGSVLATVSGEAELGFGVDRSGIEGALVVDRLTVRLPEQAASSVQPLEPHPAVRVVGADDPELGLTTRPPYPIHLRVDAQRPFWVRRNDFAVQVRAELDVRYIEPHLIVGGYASLARGHFEVFGKRFEVQRGSLTFTGEPELNPIVDLVAVYALSGSGHTVTVSASGQLYGDLRIEFASTETDDQSEIIALLVTGRTAIGSRDLQIEHQRATEQAASFLAGLSAGILTLGLRQQFGDVVPMIAIETGQNPGDARIRAGFDANALIPDFLRGIVLSAYVEGFVVTSRGTQGGGSGGVGGGVTVEFQLPHDFVLSGTYVPPANGGLDLLWEP